MSGKFVYKNTFDDLIRDNITTPFYESSISLALETIALVTRANSHKTGTKFNLVINGQALDGNGYVFPLEVLFVTKNKKSKSKLKNYFKESQIYRFRGPYTVDMQDQLIQMVNPEYFRLNDGEMEKDARLSFRYNLHNVPSDLIIQELFIH